MEDDDNDDDIVHDILLRICKRYLLTVVNKIGQGRFKMRSNHEYLQN